MITAAAGLAVMLRDVRLTVLPLARQFSLRKALYTRPGPITIANYIMCQTQVGCPVVAVGPSESPRLETTQEKKELLADQQLSAKHFNLFLG